MYMLHNQTNILATINKKITEIVGCNHDNELFLPTYIPKNFSKKILVLSGGGIKGISFIGALHALDELNILQNITTYAGTSVGSVIAFLIIIGYSPKDLFEFIKIFDFGKLKAISVSLLLESYGLDSGDKLVKMLNNFMIKKNIKTNITFEELYELTKKEFYITSVNISNRKVEYFSHKTHPSVEVVQSVRMSISIPFVFTPVHFNNCIYVDGGCIDNFPMSLFAENRNELLGICALETLSAKNTVSSISEYAIGVIYSLINGITETTIKNYEDCIIKIILDDITAVDFDISLDKKIHMFNDGYAAAHKFMLNKNNT